jgi:hypothetical protein
MADTMCFWCSNLSRDVGHTTFASGDLKNVCLAVGIFQLSFIVSELLLLPVYGGYYTFPVFQYVARRRPYFHCVGRPRKCRFSIWNFFHITCRSGFLTASGRWRPRVISVNHVGLLTLPILSGDKVQKTHFQLFEYVRHTEIHRKTIYCSKTPSSAHVLNWISDRLRRSHHVLHYIKRCWLNPARSIWNGIIYFIAFKSYSQNTKVEGFGADPLAGRGLIPTCMCHTPHEHTVKAISYPMKFSCDGHFPYL